MAIQSPIPASHVFPPKPTANQKMIMKPTNNLSSFSSPLKIRLGFSSSSFRADAQNTESADNKKHQLLAALRGVKDRGMFGVPSAKKSEIENLVKLLESRNPTHEPTLCLEKLGGAWRLIYSTITVLGSKRTKLGLRDFIALEDIFQCIDVAEGKAVNVIKFSAKGLSLLSGHLTIEASFKISSKSRVDIMYHKSVITPDQLMNVFRKNFDLLLGIFNPEGWLEITYVDDTLRIGRDNKANIFVLERQEDDDSIIGLEIFAPGCNIS